jgi:hypothetical protein
MRSNNDKYRNSMFPNREEENLGLPQSNPRNDFYEDFDDSISDMDFSNLAGKDFKKSFKQANRKIATKTLEKKTVKRTKRPMVGGAVKKKTGIAQVRTQSGKRLPVRKERLSKEIGVRRGAKINRAEKKISRILVPADKKVIVEGVNKFILSQKPNDNAVKNIGYYKGKKLKELVLIFNNTTPNPFTIELFNPSAPLDYLYNTSQNLNNKIEVAGNQVAYSDVLFNLLANPTIIPNCKFTFDGINSQQQRAIPLKVIDREITGEEYIQPLNLDLTIDNMQVSANIVFFDIMQMLNRPYIPDGMDTIEYTVLPNMSIVMAFFFEQKSLKKAFYKVARDKQPQR